MSGSRKTARDRTIRLVLWEAQLQLCCNCRVKIETFEEASIEHVIPRHRGGSDRFNNKLVSHIKCNEERGHEWPSEDLLFFQKVVHQRLWEADNPQIFDRHTVNPFDIVNVLPMGYTVEQYLERKRAKWYTTQ